MLRFIPAKRKGRTYGTIVIDLERHTVIDVLDQYATEAVEQWLVAHPDIQMICRDRNGRYATAARTAAPAARQVTDRFHLVQNLRETSNANWRCTARIWKASGIVGCVAGRRHSPRTEQRIAASKRCLKRPIEQLGAHLEHVLRPSRLQRLR